MKYLQAVMLNTGYGSDHSAAVCHRVSQTLKSTGVSHFGAKFGEERVDRCKPNFNTICERYGAVVCRSHVDIFCRLSTMHERDRQTDQGTVTSIAICDVA